MSDDDFKQTVRIVRKPKVALDEHGHSVWTDTVETAELELVSTTMLRKVLESDDKKTRRRIEEVAKGKDGVLAHDAEKNQFEIIDDDDLQAALDSAADTPAQTRSADVVLAPLSEHVNEEEELSLVSTQMLRKILAGDDPEANLDSADSVDDTGGFDPYNSG
ncbi:MAG: hypothetical protein ACR2QX_09395 [Woeseiaceae bacterium]